LPLKSAEKEDGIDSHDEMIGIIMLLLTVSRQNEWTL